MDTSVRKAKELKASEFQLEGFDVNEGPLLESIRTALVSDALGVTAELDKLNLYSSGGHFAAHYDTPGRGLLRHPRRGAAGHPRGRGADSDQTRHLPDQRHHRLRQKTHSRRGLWLKHECIHSSAIKRCAFLSSPYL